MSRTTSDNGKRIDLAGLRRTYTRLGLNESELPDEPVALLSRWFREAIETEVIEPNAMSLATIREDGTPDVRLVLLKEVEEHSVTFYTNYRSGKGNDLERHPYTACTFWWPELERQIRLRGPVTRVTREESARYFSTRPRESQLGAWASDQSTPVVDREELERRYREVEERFDGKEVPVPDHWGGYRIRLEEVEFWQGRPGRLHDRIRYERTGDSRWGRSRLAP